MNELTRTLKVMATIGVFASTALAHADDFVRFDGAACSTPPPLHCPDANCPADRVINQGPVVEMKTRRTYFLDYPCDLKPGEDVTLILSLHGGGSYGNWQRHYFPLMDYKDEYRLVIATPNSPTRVWTEADDAYLQNIVGSIVDRLGNENVEAFWLVGHSQGGMTSNRLVRTDFFKDKVDGWLSLSGGRLGGNPGRAEGFGAAIGPADASEASRRRSESIRARFAKIMARLRELPASDFSFIYTTGEREVDDAGVPATSAWAEKYQCDARVRRNDVVDTKPGYVYDGTRQDPPNPAWGLLPAPGTAEVHVYPNCKGGRVIADVIRIGKGHTEGLEPNVTEALIELMLAAPGGKIRRD